jgi:hypothetical protein
VTFNGYVVPGAVVLLCSTLGCGAVDPPSKTAGPYTPCSDPKEQQRIPYRNANICVSNGFAEFLACLEVNRLEEIADDAKKNVGGGAEGGYAGVKVSVKAEASAVGTVKTKYSSGPLADAVAACIRKYEGKPGPSATAATSVPTQPANDARLPEASTAAPAAPASTPSSPSPTPAPAPPAAATCSGSRLRLPESRAYRITDRGFDGGGAYSTALLQHTGAGDAQIDTLPFNGPKDRTVSGPAEVFVCSTNKKGGAGGCNFQCTGAHPSFHLTYPKGDGFGDKHADLEITPQ